MTKPRPVSVRSWLMADKVRGHIWARMDFPQLYTGVCTSTLQITTLYWIKIRSHIITLSVVFLISFSQLLLASSCLSFNKRLLYSRNILCCFLHQSCQGANKTQLSLSHVVRIWQMNYERQYQKTRSLWIFEKFPHWIQSIHFVRFNQFLHFPQHRDTTFKLSYICLRNNHNYFSIFFFLSFLF